MGTLRVFYYFILTLMKVSAQCNTWQQDSSVIEQFPNGILSFVTLTDNVLKCSRNCSRNWCSIFSFDEMSGNCTGFHSFAAVNWSSSLVEPIPSPVYHEGLDKIYITSGSMSLLVLKQKASYDMAKTLCSEVNGRLPIIDTDQKVNETLTILGEMSVSWIGLSDIVKEGTWLWDDGKPLSVFNDVSTSINNYDGMADGSDRFNADCAVINLQLMLIGDNNCKREYTVVCEKGQ